MSHPTGGIWAATGHRPQFIPHFSFDRLVDLAVASLKKFRPRWVLHGGAIGWDQAVGEAAIRLDVPFDLYVPFDGQEDKWGEEDRARYLRQWGFARGVILVCEGGYAAWKFKARNKALVDNSAHLLALYSGKKSGTSHAVEYAESLDHYVANVWSSWVKFGNPTAQQ